MGNEDQTTDATRSPGDRKSDSGGNTQNDQEKWVLGKFYVTEGS